ncbi:hypothetical protein [Streptomonospora litoralis]|uniref:Uncharacterized protein n=1 Tax=Streptomonospora litoralis TaxID=2498135 RepID=A0A4P6Q7Q6_9ACTN|nr:hypothetical protein [Streptomonospora litoralis]QBI54877.1 hypothetical protein EKD16_15525 [Streptomonospora litoralis]
MGQGSKQIAIMSATSIVGGLIGWGVGTVVIGAHILIPIGVVVGVAIGLSLSKMGSKQA